MSISIKFGQKSQNWWPLGIDANIMYFHYLDIFGLLVCLYGGLIEMHCGKNILFALVLFQIVIFSAYKAMYFYTCSVSAGDICKYLEQGFCNIW